MFETGNEIIEPFLEKHRIAVLTVLMGDGSPHSATLHCAWDKKRATFLFFTRKSTLKYQALASGPKKASLVFGFSEKEFCTLQMRGEARVSVDAALQEIYFKKFEHVREYAKESHAAFIEFTPSWYRYSDLKPKEPTRFESK